MPACGHLLTMIRGRATTSASCRQQQGGIRGIVPGMTGALGRDHYVNNDRTSGYHSSLASAVAMVVCRTDTKGVCPPSQVCTSRVLLLCMCVVAQKL